MTGKKLLRVSKLTTKLWWKAACLFNSCKTSERRTITSTESPAPDGLGHQSDRGIITPATISCTPADCIAGRHGGLVAKPAAGGCLPGSFAAQGRDHHAMAGTGGGGSGAFDNGAD